MATTLLFFYGPDTYRSHQKLQALKQRYIDAALGDTNLAVVDGATVMFDGLVRQFQALPFLAKTRLVVVQNLLLTGRKDLADDVLTSLPRIPSSTVVVFHEAGQPDRRTRLFKALDRPGQAERFDVLLGPALSQWVSTSAEARGITLEPAARDLLVARVSNNLWRMANELDKLAAAAAAHGINRVDRAIVAELVYHEPTSDVFALLEAVATGQSARALQLLDMLLRQGEAELSLLGMLAYELRVLIILTEAVAIGHRSIGGLAKTVGLAPFVIQKHLPLLHAFSLPLLLARHQRILAADVAIKTGQIEPRLGLELLLFELCKRQPAAERTGFPKPTTPGQ
ncbi:DNA polymerase III subunit delta [Candidatus Berkelbacteria bacterium]|nr:DNA polymerase III subunit delta [Candidatus Berkelbacteria bacterium]